MRSIYNGTILTVDLAAGKADVVDLEEPLIREWGGGLGIALALWKEEAAHGDGTSDPLILGTGPLTAGFAPASCAGVALGRSPQDRGSRRPCPSPGSPRASSSSRVSISS